MVRQKVLYARLQKAAELAQRLSVEEEEEEEEVEGEDKQDNVFHNQHAHDANTEEEGNIPSLNPRIGFYMF